MYIPPPTHENALQWLDRTSKNALSWVGNSIWQNSLTVAASGLGKGFLLTGALTMVAAGAAFALFGPGLGVGLAFGYALLSSKVGLIGLGLGAMMGSLNELRKHDNKLTAADSKSLAEVYAKEREQQKAPALAPEPVVVPPAPVVLAANVPTADDVQKFQEFQKFQELQRMQPVKSFAAAEADRRTVPPTDQLCR